MKNIERRNERHIFAPAGGFLRDVLKIQICKLNLKEKKKREIEREKNQLFCGKDVGLGVESTSFIVIYNSS